MMLKVVICGNSGVGKTTMAKRLRGEVLAQGSVYERTCGVDCSTSDIQRNNKVLKLVIWDVTGNSDYSAITSTFYQGADVIILMFDITDKESFEDLDTVWMKRIRESMYPQVIPSDKTLIVVGNKTDLEMQRSVEITKTREFSVAIEANCCMETSARSGLNTKELLDLCTMTEKTKT